jgi:hypothetical protein
MCEILLEAEPGLLDRKAISNLVSLQRKGLSNVHRLYSLTMLELWRSEYKVGLPT